ncbi:MAG: beta-ketoacyl synthase N-terminal-like domain-containing protein, partial [Pseudomonadota bacterium]
MREVMITGIGSTRFGKLEGRGVQNIAVEAVNDALARSGVERKDIGALYLGNFAAGPLAGQEVLAGIVADEVGISGIPCTKVEGACASGGIAFRHAVLAVASGQCDAAVVVGTEKMTHARGSDVTAALNNAMDNQSDGPSGLTFPGFFGLAWRVHAERYGTTRDEVSSVIIKNKANGLKNPLAQMGAELTHEIIEQSQPIADPLQLYDCCPVSDGAAALVIVAADRVTDAPDQPIRVKAAIQTSGSARLAGHNSLCSFKTTELAAEQAYRQAGISPSDLDLAEIHDCFSMAEVIHSEDLQLVPRGEGAKWAAEGRTKVGGDIAINASGGLLSKGHPVGATGVGQLYEVVK